MVVFVIICFTPEAKFKYWSNKKYNSDNWTWQTSSHSHYNICRISKQWFPLINLCFYYYFVEIISMQPSNQLTHNYRNRNTFLYSKDSELSLNNIYNICIIYIIYSAFINIEKLFFRRIHCRWLQGLQWWLYLK